MALAVSTQPNQTNGTYVLNKARSPVVYRFTGCNSEYSYKFILYCSTGGAADLTTIYATIDRVPDIDGGITVDAKNLLMNYIRNNYNIAPYTGTTGSHLNYTIIFKAQLAEYNSGSLVQTLNSNISSASMGYSENYSSFNDVEEAETILNVNGSTTYEIGSSFNLFYKYNAVATGFDITYTDSSLSAHTFTTAFDSYTVSGNYTIKHIYCGYDDLTNRYSKSVNTDYPIVVEVGSETITLNPIPCNGNTQYTIRFMNKNGVIDYVYVNGKDEITEQIDYETYKYNKIDYSTMSYNYSGGSYHKRFIMGKKKRTFNTGWINESVVERLNDLYLSELVWLNNMPIIITNTDMKYKTTRFDKLINYTIETEYAYDTINNII